MKKKITAVVMFAVLLGMSVFSGCAKKTTVKENDSFIYCLNTNKTGIVKVKYELKESAAINAAKAILEELQKPAEDIEYTPALPENVVVNQIALEGQILNVDFSEGYSEIPPLEEKLVRAAIVQSLVQVKGISAVWITVNGENMTNSSGEALGFLTSDDFVQNTGESVGSYQTGTLTLYYSNQTGDRLIPVEQEVTYSTNMANEKLIIEKLTKGPETGDVRGTMNPKVGILGVTIKDGICYVNFDQEFLTAQVDVKPEITIYSIVNSIIEGTNAAKVQITINGEKNVTYKESIDLTQTFQRNMDWVEEAEKK